MKKYLLLAAALLTGAASMNADTFDVTFNVYTIPTGGGTGTGTGGGNSTSDPIYPAVGYANQGSATYTVETDAATYTYTIKNFLGGSDYSFTTTETENTGGGADFFKFNATIDEVGTYTFPAEVVFSKNGKKTFKITNPGWIASPGTHSGSKITNDGTKLYFKRTFKQSQTCATSTDDGATWNTTTKTNMVVAGIITPALEAKSGIENVVAEENAPVEYYNLQGVRVADPQPGTLVIRRQGSKVSKMIVR